MVDLHTHSTASDGQYTPTELIQLAKEQGVSVLALTDHDTISGLEEAEKEANRLGLKFIKGIELDTKHPNAKGNFHILGYNIDPKHESLSMMCSNFSEQRLDRANRIFDYLDACGVKLNREKVFEYAGKGVIGRPHFARVMFESGYVESIQDAFDKYLGTSEFQKIERKKLHPKDAISLIKESGGYAVLAHPSQLKLSEISLCELVSELVSYGLDGIECFYSTYTEDDRKSYLSLAKQYHLFVTGGSDYHGESVKPEIHLGTGINNSLVVKSDMPFI